MSFNLYWVGNRYDNILTCVKSYFQHVLLQLSTNNLKTWIFIQYFFGWNN